MLNRKKQSGMSLTEILVVISVIAILMGISVPAAKQLAASFESGTSTRQLINAAMANARAIAVREQAYAGVRFQQDKGGSTYMIFIIHDPDPAPDGTGLANGFRAVTGRKPMKLPEDVTIENGASLSIVFSPSGKLTVHDVRISNQDGAADDSSIDTIFNTQVNVDNGDAMFVQDSADQSSIQSFDISSKSEPGIKTSEYISPYTGELVMQYRD